MTGISSLRPEVRQAEPLPCPFCGTAPFDGWQDCGTPGMDDCGYYAIECQTCVGHAFCGAHADDREEALAAWNTRARDPELVRLADEIAGWQRTYDFDCGKLIERAERAESALAAARGELEALRRELDGYRAHDRAINEALNSGDGSYRP